jgi:hypothetical protein
VVTFIAMIAMTTPLFAQPSEQTREGDIIAAQKAKVAELEPYEVGPVEAWVNRFEDAFLSGRVKWHSFFDSAYAGGGFTLGAGYITQVSS